MEKSILDKKVAKNVSMKIQTIMDLEKHFKKTGESASAVIQKLLDDFFGKK